MDRSSSWTNAGRNADYIPPSRVARMAVPSPRPPPGSTAEAVATARRAEPGSGGSILPVLPSASPNASKRSSWITPRSPSDSLDDEFHQSSSETFAPPPRRAEMASMAAARRPEPVRQRSISDGLFASGTEQAQLAYMEQMYGTINLLNAELESERRSRAALEAARPATYPAKPDYSMYEEDVQIPVGEFDEPPSGFIVSQTPVAPSYSPRKLRTMPSPPSQAPQTQHRVARPPVSPRSPLAKDQDEELCATLGKNAELRIRSRDMERTVEKTELELELARKQIKMAERRAENREEKLRALLKEKLSWQKELKATRAQVVEEKMRQVDLFREVEAAKRHFAAELEAVDQELRAAQEENTQLRTHAAEMKAQLNFQARKMEDMARQAQDEKARFVSMIEETRHRFREWKEGEAAALEDAHEQMTRNLKTEFELKLERHQDEKQKLRDKVNDLEVSMRLLQKDRALSPLELSLRKAAILGSKEHTGTVEAEQIESQSRILELENLLAHSREYQLRQESLIKLSESTISRLMQEREVTALENLSLHPFGVEPQRSEDFAYESQLMMVPSSAVTRLSSLGTPPRSHQNGAKANEPAVVRSPKSRAHTPKRADLEASIAEAGSTTNQRANTDPSSREQSLMEELAKLRKELAEAQAKAASELTPSSVESGAEIAPSVEDTDELVLSAEVPQAETNSAQDAAELNTELGGEETLKVEGEKLADAGGRPSDANDKVPCESPLVQEESSSQDADDERHFDSIVRDHVVSADEIDAGGAAHEEEIKQAAEIVLSEHDTLVVKEENEAATAYDDNCLTEPSAQSEIEPRGSQDEAVTTGAALEEGDSESPSSDVDTTQNEDEPGEDAALDSELAAMVQDSIEDTPIAVESVPSPALQPEETDPENGVVLSNTADDGEVVVCEEDFVDATALDLQGDSDGVAAGSPCTQTDEQEGFTTDANDGSIEVLKLQGEVTFADGEAVDVEEELWQPDLQVSDAGKVQSEVESAAEAAPCEANEASTGLESDQTIDSTDLQHDDERVADDGELTSASGAESIDVGTQSCTLEPPERVDTLSVELDSRNDSAQSSDEPPCRTEETEPQDLATQTEPAEAEQSQPEEERSSVTVSETEEASQAVTFELPSVEFVPTEPDVVSLETSALDETPVLENSDVRDGDVSELLVRDEVSAENAPVQAVADDATEATESSGLGIKTEDFVAETSSTPECAIPADTPVDGGLKPADEVVLSEDAVSTQEQDEDADLTQAPENVPTENEEEVLVSDPAHLAETIVTEALVALVECVALSLVSSRQEDGADTSAASHERFVPDVGDDFVAPVKTFDPVSVMEPSSSVVEDANVTSAECDESVQDIDCFVKVDEPGGATKDVDDSGIAGDEQQTAGVEEPAVESDSAVLNDDDSTPEFDKLVSVMTRAFAENFVKEVMEVFSSTAERTAIVVEEVTTAPTEIVPHEASDFTAAGTTQLVDRELEMESNDVPAATDELESTAEAEADVGNLTPFFDEQLDGWPDSTVQVNGEQQKEGESVEEVNDETTPDQSVQVADEDASRQTQDAPEEPIQDTTDEAVQAVDTFAIARDFVDAAEMKALSVVLLSMQNDGSADGEHGNDEAESDTTRSINESCNLSSEEHDEANEIDAEPELPVEYESTSDAVDIWVDEPEGFVNEIVEISSDSDADRSRSRDEENAAVLVEVSQAARRCVEQVEREALAAFVAVDTTSESANDADVTEAPAASNPSDLSPQEIVSGVACLFASQTIAEVLSRLAQSCHLCEDGPAPEGSERSGETSDDVRESESVVDENGTSRAEDAEGIWVTSTELVLENNGVEADNNDIALMETLANEAEIAADEAEKLLMDQYPLDETVADAPEASDSCFQPEELTDADIAQVLEASPKGTSAMDVNDEANPLPEDDDVSVKLVLKEMVDDIAAGDVVGAVRNTNSDVNQGNELPTCIAVDFSSDINLLADASRTAKDDEPFEEMNGQSNDNFRSPNFISETIENGSEPLPADAVEANEGMEYDVESTMRDIVDAVEIANQVESTCVSESVTSLQLSVEDGNTYDSTAGTPSDAPAEEVTDSTVESILSANTGDESIEMAAAATEEEAVVLATEDRESLGANAEGTDKQSDIDSYAGVRIGLSLEEEVDVQLVLEIAVEAVVAEGIEVPDSVDDDRVAELSTASAPVEPEVLNVVANLCASVERATAPRYPGRAQSVHFACGIKDEKPDRLGQMRRSVLLWQAPIDTACSKEAVESAVKRRASKRRISRRTLAGLLAFPTEMARFASSDTTLLAYDARHEQGEIFSLLDQSILTINPHGRHIHFDDQDDRVGSQIIGKRKTLMQELHSKNLALRQIPRFNYTPMRIKFQWSDFVVASPVRPSNSDLSISKSPVEPMRLLQKRGAKLPCGSYVVVSAFIRPLEDGNENLRVQIYDPERVEEFQFDFSEDIMKKYHLESTGMEAQSLEFLGHLEFRRDEESIIIKLPEKKAGDGSKLESDRIQSERTMVGNGDLRKREPKPNRMSAYRQQRPASSPAVTGSQEPLMLSSREHSIDSDAEVPEEPSNVEGAGILD